MDYWMETVTAICSACSKEYDALAINGHVDAVKICGDCMRAIAAEFVETKKEKKYI